jgi:6-pyruvoyltetrahydropterin/6-carboxytetrahydropterin synthase
MINVVRKVTFCAGHRLWKHEDCCSQIHGHNYTAMFHATAEHLDEVGRVVDFRVLKERMGGWIDEHWDHGFLCHRDDAEARRALAGICDQKLFVLDANPTAENMALHLLRVVGPEVLAGTGVRVVRVQLWETENCCADVSL